MSALVASVAVHSVMVDHEFELLAMAMEFVNEPERVLEMDIVVARAVGKLEHDWLHAGRCAVLNRIFLYIIDYASKLVTLRI